MVDKKEEKKVELTEIVTQTSVGYKLPDGEVVTIDGLLIWIANQMIELRKVTG